MSDNHEHIQETPEFGPMEELTALRALMTAYEAQLSQQALNISDLQLANQGLTRENARLKERYNALDREFDEATSAYDQLFEGFGEKSEERNELAFKATHDSLTELNNRAGFIHDAESLINGSDPATERAGVLFIDLDGFKALNDSLGHDEGDKALVRTAELLREVFGDDTVLGRWAGDEFVVLYTLLAEHADEQQDYMLPYVREFIDEHLKKSWSGIGASVGSSGLHEIDSSGDDLLREMLRKADTAMYLIKGERKSTVKGGLSSSSR